jgi:sulfur-carrier protein adenylyltransferase/sulfurtransferase
MKPRVILSIAIICMGLIIAAVPPNTTKPYKLTAAQLLEEANARGQFISPQTLADMIVKKDPSLRLIDIRDKDEYDKYHLPDAVNIPLTDLLSDEFTDIIDQEIKMNVFYSNGSLQANEAWLITRQLGYQNNYVLEGGLNYWFEVIMNPQKPSSTSPDEEFARYDFSKSASQALGGGNAVIQATDNSQAAAKPAITGKPKKKKASGGC